MKTILFLTLCFSVCSVVQAATYLGKPITPARVKQFHAYYAKNRIFADPSGKVYDLTDPEAQTGIHKPGSAGRQTGTNPSIGSVTAAAIAAPTGDKSVVNVTEQYEEEVRRLAADNHLRRGPAVFEIVKVPRTRTWPCCLDGVVLRPGERWQGLAVISGTWYDTAAKRSLPLLKVLKPVTLEQFEKYLNSGAKLYYYKKLVIRAKYKTCPKCGGFGQVRPDPKKLSFETCPECKGKRKLEISPARIEYKKIPVKK